MKVLFGIISIWALVTICGCIYRASREKNKLAHIVARLLEIGFIIVFINTISLLSMSETMEILTHSAHFAATGWLLYYLLRFSIEYTGGQFERYVKRRLMILLLWIDSASLMLNVVFKHQFTVYPVIYWGEQYYELTLSPVFYIHVAFMLFLVSLCLISLFYRAFHAPVFYRRKFALIGIMTVIMLIISLLTIKTSINAALLGFVAEAVCIYYCTFIYTPQRLLRKTVFSVVDKMAVSLFVVDVDGNRLYTNESAGKILDSETAYIHGNELTLEQWCSKEYAENDEEFVREETFYYNGEEKIFKIQLKRMLDIRKQLQGGYFVIQDRTEEIQSLKREHYLATHDSLTGIYNKEHFYKKAQEYIRKNRDEELLIICADIKDFKLINDSMGTVTGDHVLQEFARILSTKVQGIIVYGRLGNDNFGMLMRKSDYKEEIFSRDESDTYFSGLRKEVSIPIVSYVGVYEVTEPDLPVSVMCDRAKMAIATIKGDYRKRLAYYDAELRESILREQELIAELEDAMAQGHLKMFLQPQMTANGKLLGAEALVRWMHPEKGPILPNKFIPIYEKNGLISDLDMYVWELACKQLRSWKDMGREDIYISVNISPRDFYFLNVFQIFMELVEKYDIAPRNIKLEITETAVVLDLERQIELIKRLRRNGFIVEMDDFGTGYSSLNMLKDIHVDVLKIDQAFLKKAEDGERSKKILQMMINLSSQLDIPVIIEGVETAEQVEELSKMGCEMFQGYYFAKPMSVKEFEERYF